MSAKNIQVAIKVRPLLRKEKEQKLTSPWKIVKNSIQLAESQTEPFVFDYIFNEDASNEIIFNQMAKPVVHSVVKGINGTIFAYGQTSSGKTYTMMGDEQNPGVMVLAAEEIFKQIENIPERQFLISVGYIQIYNEKIYDLLNKKNQDLKIHEQPTGNVSVNCEECVITSISELINYLCLGNKERIVGETNMNERSSRSHAIFRITIESRKMDRSEDRSVNQSVLNLVDLAGSERADQTGARGARLKEGGHINKSLHFLSNVIKTLSEKGGDGEKFISYRDSKLTRILQASLGGNALTSVICTIKPTAVEETQSTLNFAMRAKSVKNKPEVNEILSDAAKMKRLEVEINRLNALLTQERSKNESQIKVNQLEERIKTELLKIISANSLHSLNKTENVRRRTWCPATSLTVLTETNCNSDSNIAKAIVPAATKPTKLQLPKPARYLTPQIGQRAFSSKITLEQIPNVQEEPLLEFKLSLSSPQGEKNEKMDDCKTPKFSGQFCNVSISPTIAENPQKHLEIVESDLKQLEEFTSLENKLDINHDAYEAIKQHSRLVIERNRFLEDEHLKHIVLKDEHSTVVKKLNDCQKSCDELRSQIENLTGLNQIANEKNISYEKQFNELQMKIKQLEMENREAVSLDFEYKSYKNKSRLRETDLLGVISEKEKEIEKLEKSLQQRAEAVFQNSKEELLQQSRFIHLPNETVTEGVIDNVCVKCEDLQRLLEENKKVTQEFEKLTLEYEKLQLNFTAITKDANNSQIKLTELEIKNSKNAEECEKLRTEITELRQKLEQIQIDYTKLNCDNEDKTEALLNQKITEANLKYASLQEKYARLENAWDEQENTIKKIQTEYDAIQLKYQKLQSEYDSLEKKSTQTMEECARLQLANENLQTEISALKVRVEETQQKLILEAGAESVNLKKTNEQLQAELLGAEKQFNDMQKEYDDLSNELMDSLQETETLKNQNAKLEKDVKELKDQNEQLNHLINKLSQDHMLTIEEMRDQISRLSAELFEKSIFVDNCACDDYKKQIEVLQTKVKSYQHDVTNELGLMEQLNFKSSANNDTKSNETLISETSMLFQVDDSIRDVKGNVDFSSTLDYSKINQTVNERKYSAAEEMLDPLKDVVLENKLNETLTDPLDLLKNKAPENKPSDMLSKDPLTTEVPENKPNDTLTDENEIEQLNDIIKVLEETVENLSNDLISKQQEIKMQQEENISLQQNYTAAQQNYDTLRLEHQQKMDEFQKMRQEYDSNCAALTQETTDALRVKYEQTIQELQQKLDDSIALLACKEKEYKQECSRLELEFYEKLEQNEAGFRENLRKYNHDWQIAKEDYEKINSTLREKIAQCKCATIEQEKQELQAKFESELKQMQKKLENYASSIEKLKHEEVEATESPMKISEKAAEIEDLQERLNLSVEKWLVQKEILDKVQQEKNELQAKFESELKKMQEKLENYESSIEKLKHENTVATENQVKISEKAAEIDELQKRLNLSAAEIDELQKRLNLSAAEVDELQTRLNLSVEKWLVQKEILDRVQLEKADIEMKMIQLQENNAKLIAESNGLEKVNNENSERINALKNSLETEIAMKNAEINELQKHTKTLKDECNKLLVKQTEICEKAVLENEKKKAKLIQIKEISTKLFEELDQPIATKEEVSRGKVLIQTLQKYIQVLASKFNQLLQINDMWNEIESEVHIGAKYANAEQLQQKFEHIEKIIEEELTKQSLDKENNFKFINKILELENEIEQLNLSKTQTHSEKDALLKTIEKMSATQKQFENTIQNLQTERTQLQTALKTLQCQHNELQQKFNQLNEETQQLKHLSSKLEWEKQLVEQQLHELDSTHTEQETILKGLQKQLNSFEALNSENSQLKQKIETLKESYIKNQASLQEDNKKLQTAFSDFKIIQHEMEDKKKTLELKIEGLNRELLEVRVKASAYDKLLIEHEKVENRMVADKLELQREIKELQSNVAELQFKLRLSEECKVRLQEACKNLETRLKEVQKKVGLCENQSLELEKLKSEKVELQARIETAAREASEASKTASNKIAHYEMQLQQLTENFNSQCTLMSAKENAFESEKQKLEVIIKTLQLEKESLEEKIAIESALKKTMLCECSLMKKKGNSKEDLNENKLSSPPTRTSLDRIMDENHERKNRRISTHDERRRQSLWGFSREASVMTDPTDSNCNCIELDLKLKEAERKLFISESHVTTINMKLKNHPLKNENKILEKRLLDEREKHRTEADTLLKRLHDEQEKHRNEVKKYKSIIVEQKTKTANLISTNSFNNCTSPAETKKILVVANAECQTVSKLAELAHVECQTESEYESALRKLEIKYKDIKNICRSRYTEIKELKTRLEVLTKEKENTDSNVPLSCYDMGQIKSLKRQCETLKKELEIIKQKYDCAKTVLHNRREEIKSLRAQLNLNSESQLT